MDAPPSTWPPKLWRHGRSLPLHGVFAFVLFILVSPPAQATPQAPQLDTDAPTATAGYFQLSWESAIPHGAYELQAADSPDFASVHTLYQGPDLASLQSGYANGTYYFRLRVQGDDKQWSPWSPVVPVNVAHHSLARAWGFFAIGAFVFLATLGVILKGGGEASSSSTRESS